MFAIPALGDLVNRVRAAFRANLPGLDAWLPLNNIAPTAKVIAGALYELFGRLSWVADQAFVTTSSMPYLAWHGQQYGITQNPAQLATGNVVLTVSAATSIAAGAIFQRSDGAAFVAGSTSSSSGAGTITVPVVAEVAGADANTAGGAPLTIVSGVSGAGAATATAAFDTAGVVNGLDLESVEAYRARILFRLQNPPNGGCPADYVRWTSGTPGVTRVYVERCWGGAGNVRVFPIFDDLFASTGGVADSGHVAAVAATLAPQTPSDAVVTVVAPTPTVINVTVANLSPSSAAVQAAVNAELADAFRRFGQVAGGDTPTPGMPFLATPFAFSLSWIYQAVANATGEARAQITAPTADVSISAGCIPVLGTVTFV